MNSIIFEDGYCTTNQIVIYWIPMDWYWFTSIYPWKTMVLAPPTSFVCSKRYFFVESLWDLSRWPIRKKTFNFQTFKPFVISNAIGGDWNHGILWLSILIGNVIIPTDEVIFFRGVGIPPTRIVYFPFHIWDNPSHWLSYFSRWLLHHQPVMFSPSLTSQRVRAPLTGRKKNCSQCPRCLGPNISELACGWYLGWCPMVPCYKLYSYIVYKES